MSNKTLFLFEILKSKKTKLMIKDFCQCGLCPVILNQVGIIFETKKEVCRIQASKQITD
ncbi:MAG: hypothetical protein ACOYOK_10160 [Pseudobdellovibrionaceae bacterium]